MALDIGRAFRLFCYFVVITFSITSFALIVHDLKPIISGVRYCFPHLYPTGRVGTSTSICNFGIADNVIMFVFALFTFLFVLVGSFVSSLEPHIFIFEVVVNGFNTIWAMIWAIVVSARIGGNRSQKENAVLGFSWIDFGLLLFALIVTLAMERGQKGELADSGETETERAEA
ncbi:hypothetical protein F1559_004405 [Cyanidiococcus yangmingshanensis]|uniref:MARVEL domain-containing protein n=1 Tax=Cyanidiococcus yangmingshanensis TaxID=2690220 RepID=A0A7J7IIR3_9RHOD|nr:hypothetical protein F1559_004405 [Cyanidiococcus yangmingshanensis]